MPSAPASMLQIRVLPRSPARLPDRIGWRGKGRNLQQRQHDRDGKGGGYGLEAINGFESQGFCPSQSATELPVVGAEFE